MVLHGESVDFTINVKVVTDDASLNQLEAKAKQAQQAVAAAEQQLIKKKGVTDLGVVSQGAAASQQLVGLSEQLDRFAKKTNFKLLNQAQTKRVKELQRVVKDGVALSGKLSQVFAEQQKAQLAPIGQMFEGLRTLARNVERQITRGTALAKSPAAADQVRGQQILKELAPIYQAIQQTAAAYGQQLKSKTVAAGGTARTALLGGTSGTNISPQRIYTNLSDLVKETRKVAYANVTDQRQGAAALKQLVGVAPLLKELNVLSQTMRSQYNQNKNIPGSYALSQKPEEAAARMLARGIASAGAQKLDAELLAQAKRSTESLGKKRGAFSAELKKQIETVKSTSKDAAKLAEREAKALERLKGWWAKKATTDPAARENLKWITELEKQSSIAPTRRQAAQEAYDRGTRGESAKQWVNVFKGLTTASRWMQRFNLPGTPAERTALFDAFTKRTGLAVPQDIKGPGAHPYKGSGTDPILSKFEREFTNSPELKKYLEERFGTGQQKAIAGFQAAKKRSEEFLAQWKGTNFEKLNADQVTKLESERAAVVKNLRSARAAVMSPPQVRFAASMQKALKQEAFNLGLARDELNTALKHADPKANAAEYQNLLSARDDLEGLLKDKSAQRKTYESQLKQFRKEARASTKLEWEADAARLRAPQYTGGLGVESLARAFDAEARAAGQEQVRRSDRPESRKAAMGKLITAVKNLSRVESSSSQFQYERQEATRLISELSKAETAKLATSRMTKSKNLASKASYLEDNLRSTEEVIKKYQDRLQSEKQLSPQDQKALDSATKTKSNLERDLNKVRQQRAKVGSEQATLYQKGEAKIYRDVSKALAKAGVADFSNLPPDLRAGLTGEPGPTSRPAKTTAPTVPTAPTLPAPKPADIKADQAKTLGKFGEEMPGWRGMRGRWKAHRLRSEPGIFFAHDMKNFMHSAMAMTEVSLLPNVSPEVQKQAEAARRKARTNVDRFERIRQKYGIGFSQKDQDYLNLFKAFDKTWKDVDRAWGTPAAPQAGRRSFAEMQDFSELQNYAAVLQSELKMRSGGLSDADLTKAFDTAKTYADKISKKSSASKDELKAVKNFNEQIRPLAEKQWSFLTAQPGAGAPPVVPPAGPPMPPSGGGGGEPPEDGKKRKKKVKDAVDKIKKADTVTKAVRSRKKVAEENTAKATEKVAQVVQKQVEAEVTEAKAAEEVAKETVKAVDSAKKQTDTAVKEKAKQTNRVKVAKAKASVASSATAPSLGEEISLQVAPEPTTAAPVESAVPATPTKRPKLPRAATVKAGMTAEEMGKLGINTQGLANIVRKKAGAWGKGHKITQEQADYINQLVKGDKSKWVKGYAEAQAVTTAPAAPAAEPVAPTTPPAAPTETKVTKAVTKSSKAVAKAIEQVQKTTLESLRQIAHPGGAALEFKDDELMKAAKDAGLKVNMKTALTPEQLTKMRTQLYQAALEKSGAGAALGKLAPEVKGVLGVGEVGPAGQVAAAQGLLKSAAGTQLAGRTLSRTQILKQLAENAPMMGEQLDAKTFRDFMKTSLGYGPGVRVSQAALENLGKAVQARGIEPTPANLASVMARTAPGRRNYQYQFPVEDLTRSLWAGLEPGKMFAKGGLTESLRTTPYGQNVQMLQALISPNTARIEAAGRVSDLAAPEYAMFGQSDRYKVTGSYIERMGAQLTRAEDKLTQRIKAAEAKGQDTTALQLQKTELSKQGASLASLSQAHGDYVRQLDKERGALAAFGTDWGDKAAAKITKQMQKLTGAAPGFEGAELVDTQTGKAITQKQLMRRRTQDVLRQALKLEPQAFINDLDPIIAERAQRMTEAETISRRKAARREENVLMREVAPIQDVITRRRENLFRQEQASYRRMISGGGGGGGGGMPPGGGGPEFPGIPYQGRIPSIPSGFRVGGYLGSLARGDRAGGVMSRVKSVTEFTGAALVTQGLFAIPYKAIAAVAEADKAVINLRKVTGASEGTAMDLRRSAIDAAQRYGKGTADLLESYVVFAQQGLSTPDIKKRGNEAAKISRVSAMDTADVTETVTAGLKVFGDQVGNSGERLMDSFLAVEQRNAVTEQDLAEIMRRVGASASTSKVDIHQLNALGTVIQERTRAGGTQIGTALRLIFRNLGDVKRLSTLQQQGIPTMEEGGQDVKGAFDIMGSMAKRWKGLTSLQKRQMAFTVAETRFSNMFMNLMEGWDKTGGIVEQSKGAQGTTQQRLDVVMQGLEGQIGKLGASFEDLAISVGDGLKKPLIDSMNILGSMLRLVSKLASLKIPGTETSVGEAAGTLAVGYGISRLAGMAGGALFRRGLTPAGAVRSNFMTRMTGLTTESTRFAPLSNADLESRYIAYTRNPLRRYGGALAGTIGAGLTRLGFGPDATRLARFQRMRENLLVEREGGLAEWARRDTLNKTTTNALQILRTPVFTQAGTEMRDRHGRQVMQDPLGLKNRRVLSDFIMGRVDPRRGEFTMRQAQAISAQMNEAYARRMYPTVAQPFVTRRTTDAEGKLVRERVFNEAAWTRAGYSGARLQAARTNVEGFWTATQGPGGKPSIRMAGTQLDPSDPRVRRLESLRVRSLENEQAIQRARASGVSPQSPQFTQLVKNQAYLTSAIKTQTQRVGGPQNLTFGMAENRVGRILGENGLFQRGRQAIAATAAREIPSIFSTRAAGFGGLMGATGRTAATVAARGVGVVTGAVGGALSMLGPAVALTAAFYALEKAVGFATKRYNETASGKAERLGFTKRIEEGEKASARLSNMVNAFTDYEKYVTDISKIQTTPGLKEDVVKQREMVKKGELGGTLGELVDARNNAINELKQDVYQNVDAYKELGVTVGKAGQLLYQGGDITRSPEAIRKTMLSRQRQIDRNLATERLGVSAMQMRDVLKQPDNMKMLNQLRQGFAENNRIRFTGFEKAVIGALTYAPLVGNQGFGRLATRAFAPGAIQRAQAEAPERRAMLLLERQTGRFGEQSGLAGFLRNLQSFQQTLPGQEGQKRMQNIMGQGAAAFFGKGFSMETQKIMEDAIRAEFGLQADEMWKAPAFQAVRDLSRQALPENQVVREGIPVGLGAGRTDKQVAQMVAGMRETDLIKAGKDIYVQMRQVDNQKMYTVLRGMVGKGGEVVNADTLMSGQESVDKVVTLIRQTTKPTEGIGLYRNEQAIQARTENLMAHRMAYGYGAGAILPTSGEFKTGPTRISQLSEQLAGTITKVSDGMPIFNTSMQEFLRQAGIFQKQYQAGVKYAAEFGLAKAGEMRTEGRTTLGTKRAGEGDATQEDLQQAMETSNMQFPTAQNQNIMAGINALISWNNALGRVNIALDAGIQATQRFADSMQTAAEIPITTTGPLAAVGGALPPVQLGKTWSELGGQERGALFAFNEMRNLSIQQASMAQARSAVATIDDSISELSNLFQQPDTAQAFKSMNPARLQELMNNTTAIAELGSGDNTQVNLITDLFNRLDSLASGGGTQEGIADLGEQLLSVLRGRREEIISNMGQAVPSMQYNENAVKSANALGQLSVAAESAARSLSTIRELEGTFKGMSEAVGEGRFGILGPERAPVVMRGPSMETAVPVKGLDRLDQFQAQRRMIMMQMGASNLFNEQGERLPRLSPQQAGQALRMLRFQRQRAERSDEWDQRAERVKAARDTARTLLTNIVEIQKTGGEYLTPDASKRLAGFRSSLEAIGRMGPSAFSIGGKPSATILESTIDSIAKQLGKTTINERGLADLAKSTPTALSQMKSLAQMGIGGPGLQQAIKEAEKQQQKETFEPITSSIDKGVGTIGGKLDTINSTLGGKNEDQGTNKQPSGGTTGMAAQGSTTAQPTAVNQGVTVPIVPQGGTALAPAIGETPGIAQSSALPISTSKGSISITDPLTKKTQTLNFATSKGLNWGLQQMKEGGVLPPAAGTLTGVARPSIPASTGAGRTEEVDSFLSVNGEMIPYNQMRLGSLIKSRGWNRRPVVGPSTSIVKGYSGADKPNEIKTYPGSAEYSPEQLKAISDADQLLSVNGEMIPYETGTLQSVIEDRGWNKRPIVGPAITIADPGGRGVTDRAVKRAPLAQGTATAQPQVLAAGGQVITLPPAGSSQAVAAAGQVQAATEVVKAQQAAAPASSGGLVFDINEPGWAAKVDQWNEAQAKAQKTAGATPLVQVPLGPVGTFSYKDDAGNLITADAETARGGTFSKMGFGYTPSYDEPKTVDPSKLTSSGRNRLMREAEQAAQAYAQTGFKASSDEGQKQLNRLAKNPYGEQAMRQVVGNQAARDSAVGGAESPASNIADAIKSALSNISIDTSNMETACEQGTKRGVEQGATAISDAVNQLNGAISALAQKLTAQQTQPTQTSAPAPASAPPPSPTPAPDNRGGQGMGVSLSDVHDLVRSAYDPLMREFTGHTNRITSLEQQTASLASSAATKEDITSAVNSATGEIQRAVGNTSDKMNKVAQDASAALSVANAAKGQAESIRNQVQQLDARTAQLRSAVEAANANYRIGK